MFFMRQHIVKYKRHAEICVLLFMAVMMTGCSALNRGASVSKTDFVLDTVANITIFDGMDKEDAERILEESFDEIRRYEELFSAEKEESDVSRINRAAGAETEVAPETAELISVSLKYSELSGGVFDITIRPVSKLWDFKSGKGVPPDDADIKEALKHVGYENVILDCEKNTVRLKDPEAEIDLGGIAKGYIADRIKEYLINKGVKSAIINLGGNVLLIGSKPDGSDFGVGIEKPFGDGEMVDTIKVSDRSVVTSGNYERCFYYEDRLYHHILDTSTGYPADGGLNAVTVVSGHSVDGDALSTTCFCLGAEKAEELISNIADEDIKVYYIDKDSNLIQGR
ncbi:MAG: FAD:protein FMN transferase [Lachnospiraceae bacterium]|nr:FAD:protein FMN transferase [Lachnospiraceae bacterium]